MNKNINHIVGFESLVEGIGKDVGEDFIEYDIRFDEVEAKSNTLKKEYGCNSIREWDQHFWSGFGEAISEASKKAGREYVEWSDTVDADSMTPKDAEAWITDNLYSNISGSEIHMYMQVKFNETFEQTPYDIYDIAHQTWKNGFHKGVVDEIATF